jgi:hypothetical protein
MTGLKPSTGNELPDEEAPKRLREAGAGQCAATGTHAPGHPICTPPGLQGRMGEAGTGVAEMTAQRKAAGSSDLLTSQHCVHGQGACSEMSLFQGLLLLGSYWWHQPQTPLACRWLASRWHSP